MRIAGLIAATLALSACADNADPPTEQTQPPRFELASSNPIEHGQRLSAVLGCIGCHGLELTGEDWTEPEMGVLWTANLTQSVARYSDEELIAMITEGHRSDRALMEMPSFLFGGLHPDDLDALVAYLNTLEPTGEIHPDPTIGPQLQRMIESGEWVDSVQDVARKRDQFPPDLGPEHAYGRFILRATCVECHGMDLRGSEVRIPGAPDRPDLRMVAAYTREDFAHFMETGEAVGGRELTLMSAVARRRYSPLTDAEEDAMHAYLVELAERDP